MFSRFLFALILSLGLIIPFSNSLYCGDGIQDVSTGETCDLGVPPTSQNLDFEANLEGWSWNFYGNKRIGTGDSVDLAPWTPIEGVYSAKILWEQFSPVGNMTLYQDFGLP